MMKNIIAIDLGKTKIASALISNEKLSCRNEIKTDIDRGGEFIIEQVLNEIDRILKFSNTQIDGIGIGTSGVVDSYNKTILSSGSIPNWNNINVGKIIDDKFNLPLMIDNDVYVGALGEHYYGNDIKGKIAIYFTISTGVGLAIISNNKIIHGAHNLSGQIAHLFIDEENTLNDVFSGKGIENQGKIKIGTNIKTKDVFFLAKNGNENAQFIIDNAAKKAGFLISFIQNILDPDYYILDGSVALKNKFFVDLIQIYAKKYLSNYSQYYPNDLKLINASLGNNSVLYGCSALWSEYEK